jgi:cell division protein FtsI/penicillin-binding protein 2
MKRAFALALAIALCGLSGRGASLYEQSVQRALSQRFNSGDVSYLLVDAQTKTVIASRWPDSDRPVPPGSLLKPFVALAYAKGHDFKYPVFVCRGSIDGCWYPPGHGRIGITQAIEYSCNTYFLKLARRVSPQDMRGAAEQFGIVTAPRAFTPAALIGLGGTWRIAPRQLARAYLNLAAQADESGVAPLIRGMALSAEAGTTSAIDRALGGRAALAKSGTAPCIHSTHAPGDGYVMVLYPADSPRLLLLVCVHGVPGAKAAATAGRILRVAVDGT